MDEKLTRGSYDYFKTIVLMCDDVLQSTEGISELSAISRSMEGLLQSLREEDSYEPGHVLSLENALNRYRVKISSLYSRFPDDTFLEGLLRRIDSLRDMCAGCLSSSPDAQQGT